MADMHITRELLEAITRGEIPVRVLEDLILDHLRRVWPWPRPSWRTPAAPPASSKRQKIISSLPAS